MILATILWIAGVVYLLPGILFVIPFITKGVTRIDEGAHGAGWSFRLIIIPGTIIFWPVLLKKWLSAIKQKSND